MEEQPKSIYWEGPEHYQSEKTGDWFWVLGILALAGAITSIILGNTLFGVVIILAALAMTITVYRGPRTILFEVSLRGVKVDNILYPYATLESYYLDEENLVNPQLILKSQKMLMPLIIIPLPEEYVDVVEDMVNARLPEEYLEEPLSHKILEFFGF